MKKGFLFGILAALAVFGCQVREEIQFASDGKAFTATTEEYTVDAPGVETKTYMDAGGTVLWKRGDQVSIFAGSTINEHYQVTDASDGKTAAALNRVESPGSVPSEAISNNVAFYPYAETTELAKDGSSYVIRDIALPSTQYYASASFGNGAFPMVAVTSSTRDSNLKFKNVLGGLKLQLTGTATIKAISITGNDNEILCGAAEVTVSTPAAPAVSLNDATATTVTLDCGDGVQLDETTATAFIIALPPMTMTNGFTITVTDTANSQMEIKSSKTQTITRSSILSMPAVIVPENFTESGIARITVSAENTRTANSGMSTVWSADDTLNIFTAIPDSGLLSQGKASIEDGIGSSTAVFSFNYIAFPTASVDWYVLYPYNPANTTPSSLAVDMGATSVTQNGYDDTAHLAGSLCPLYGIAEDKTVNEAVVSVHHLCSFVEFDITNNTGSTLIIKSVKLDATEEIVGGFTVDILGSEPVFTASSASTAATVNISDPASLDNGSVAKAYLPIKPYIHNISDEFNVTVTLEADGSTGDVPFHLTLSNAEDGTFSAGLIKPVALNLTSDMLIGSLKITGITPRYHSATVTGEASIVGTSIIQYRRSGASSWQSASSSTSAGTVSADITDLADNSTYEVRISIGSDNGPSETFTTKKEKQLYNMNFDNWCKDGSAWCCYGDLFYSEKIWENVNGATAGLGYNVTTPEESDVVNGKAAKLESQKVMGQFVAGCLFTGLSGSFIGDSFNATIKMGIPFIDRPAALTGYAKYISYTIDYVKAPHTNKIGTPDSGRLFVLLTDWDSPFAVMPSRKILIDFNHNTNSSIIGYGEMLFEGTDEHYNQFTIPIEYYSDSTPKYVVICGTSSALGVYFTGGKGSTLYLDEFEFIYE